MSGEILGKFHKVVEPESRIKGFSVGDHRRCCNPDQPFFFREKSIRFSRIKQTQKRCLLPGSMAPPWVRLTNPSVSNIARSRRTVASETSRNKASSSILALRFSWMYSRVFLRLAAGKIVSWPFGIECISLSLWLKPDRFILLNYLIISARYWNILQYFFLFFAVYSNLKQNQAPLPGGD